MARLRNVSHPERTRRLVFATFVAALFGLVSVSSVGAETELEVTTTADGLIQVGSPTILIVTLGSDHALEGTIIVAVDGSRVNEIRVQVPGGSSKDFGIEVTLPPWQGSNVVVSFEGKDGSDNTQARLTLRYPQGDEIVGVLPDLGGRNLPEVAELTVDIGIARFHPIEVDHLAFGPSALGPFDHVLATPDDLANLAPDELEAVLSWVGSGGGSLVIDASPDTELAFEPVLGSNGHYRYGLGQVTFTNGAAAAGAYDGLISPTRETGDSPWGLLFGGIPTSMLLATDAGLSIPSIRSIVILLGVYAFVVGPLLWLVLRKTSRETVLWLVVPLLALGTTAGVYVVGRQQRLGVNTAHASIVIDLPTERIMQTDLLVSSPNGGTEGIILEDPWAPASTGTSEDMWFGRNPSATPRQFVDGNDLVIDLPPGGSGVVSAIGSFDKGEALWDVQLRYEGTKIVGTITNLTPYDMHEVLLALGPDVGRIGTVAAGEQHEVAVTVRGGLNVNGDSIAEAAFNFDPFDSSNEFVNPGTLLDAMTRLPAIRMPESLLVVGWTNEAASPVRSTKGAKADAGRTAMMSVFHRQDVLSLGAEPESEASVSTDPLRFGAVRVLDVPISGECNDISVTLQLTPSSIPTAANALTLEVFRRTVAAFDVWDGTQWVPGGMAQVDPTAKSHLVAVPATAYSVGSVYVRATLTCEFWGSSNLVKLRSLEPGESSTSLEASADLGDEATEEDANG